MKIYMVSSDYDVIDRVGPEKVIYRDLFNTYITTNDKLFVVNEEGQVAEMNLSSVKEIIKMQEENNVFPQ